MISISTEAVTEAVENSFVNELFENHDRKL